MSTPLILLTNDDGIDSLGLHTAAVALARLGEVVVAAPSVQQSGAGRSMLALGDGLVEPHTLAVNGLNFAAFSVGGTPAQTVKTVVLQHLSRLPDLCVSGINYGENIGSGITISGTVGAALQAASHGIPAIAVSLEVDPAHHNSNDRGVDFTIAAEWTARFAEQLLHTPPTHDLDVLKIDIPAGATIDTPWRLTRQSRQKYWIPQQQPSQAGVIEYGYAAINDFTHVEPDSDIFTVAHDHLVSVTPISLDLTARIDFAAYEAQLRTGPLA